MFKTPGIRTLLMACGGVALMALITQQNLAAQSIPPTVTLTLNNRQPINVTEGDSFTLFYTLKNQSSQEITLGNPPNISNFSNHQTGGTDSTDNLTVASVAAWKQGAKIVLEGSEVSGIQAEFNTPAIPENEVENKDRGEWGVSLRFDPGTYPNPTQGGPSLPLPSVLALADVFVNDRGVSPVVPEPSTFILVGACALSVCGFGWLRRRRIPSAA
jgi:hypothetical protein